MSVKCWTVVCGVPVQFESLAKLGIEIDETQRDINKAKSAAEEEGHLSAFKIRNRMVYLGEIPNDRKIINKVTPARTAGGPLLRAGHCTHRLGVHRGGQW